MLSLMFLVYSTKHSAHSENRDQRMRQVVAYGGFDCIYNYYFSINAICVCLEPRRQQEQM